ncbi:MAG: ATP synthase F1 subunit delta [Clostridia bacterium]|nr:ATP synthase F1 subunit delta [Clostridia bacterium]
MADVAKEYGAALFLLASEQNAREEYKAALDGLVATLRETPEYLEMLACPAIPKKERLAAIEQVFATRVPEHLLSYLQLLCEKGRTHCFFESAAEFSSLYDAAERIFTARVVSAVALNVDERARLTETLSTRYGGRVLAEYAVDPALLGGIVVEIDGKILDGSLRRRLQEAKEVMKQ